MLSFDIGTEEPFQFRFPFRAPGKGSLERFGQRAASIDRERIDREAGVFSRKSRVRLCQAQFIADEVEAVRGIGAVKDGE